MGKGWNLTITRMIHDLGRHRQIAIKHTYGEKNPPHLHITHNIYTLQHSLVFHRMVIIGLSPLHFVPFNGIILQKGNPILLPGTFVNIVLK